MDTTSEFLQGRDLFDRWWSVGSAKGLTTDAEIARFLLDQYELHSQDCEQLLSSRCVYCHTPLTLYCDRCQRPSQQTAKLQSPHTLDTPRTITSGSEELHPKYMLHGKQRDCGMSPSSEEASATVPQSGSQAAGGKRMDTGTPHDKDTLDNTVVKTEITDSKASQDCDSGTVLGENDLSLNEGDQQIRQKVGEAVKGDGQPKQTVEDALDRCPFVCHVCHKMFMSSAKLQDHQNTHAQQDSGDKQGGDVTKDQVKKGKEVTCEECGMITINSSALKTHMLIHRGEKPFECDICGQKYRQSSHLVTHRRTHTGEKPFKCGFCAAAFRTKSQLTLHMCKHTGVYPYVCQECNLGCITPNDLEKHMRTHTGEKPFKCDDCGATFRVNGQLKKHWQVHHSGEKPFECKFCDAAYSNKPALSNHMKKHEKQKSRTSAYLVRSSDQNKRCPQTRTSTTELPETQKPSVNKTTEIKQEEVDSLDSTLANQAHPDKTSVQTAEGVLPRHEVKTQKGLTECKSEDFSDSEQGMPMLDENDHSLEGDSAFQAENKDGQNLDSVGELLSRLGGKLLTDDINLNALVSKPRIRRNRQSGLQSRSYKCKHCEARFVERGTLTQHMLTHSAEDLHACDKCGKTFALLSKLLQHQDEHATAESGESQEKTEKVRKVRTVMCQKCGKGFTTFYHLRKHAPVCTGGKPFSCEFCGRGFIHRSKLKIHRRIHTGEKPYKCSYCDASFQDTVVLNTHMYKHTGMYPYKCNQCSYGCITPSTLRKHMRTHTGEKPFQCEECGKAFSVNGQLKRHWEVHHSGETPFKCTVCGAAYSNKPSLSNHMKKHLCKTKNFICETCGAAFSTPTSLKKHMICHSNERPFICSKCGAGFKARANMLKHMKRCGNNLPREKNFVCSLCDKRLTTKWAMQNHMNIHTGEKLFKCDVCSAEFNCRPSLSKHMLVKHTANKMPQVCEDCGKVFPCAAYLTRHRKCHAEKIFKCPECDARFARKIQVQNHMLVHTGAKPFVCTVCGARFPRAPSLRVHMRLKHTGEKPYRCRDCNCSFALSRDLKKHKERFH